MPYIQAVEGPEQAPRIMGGTRVSLFSLDDDEFFPANDKEKVSHPYTYDSAGEKVLLEHTDLNKLLDWLQVCVDTQITPDYLKAGKMPYINVELFTRDDLYGISVSASSVGEETRKLAEQLFTGPDDEGEDAPFEDDEEGITASEDWKELHETSTSGPDEPLQDLRED